MPNVSDAPTMPRRSLRVMLVDDHETVRQGLRLLFQSIPDVQIVHEALDGETALAAVRTVAPDLLVIDLSMPGVNGLTLMRRLQHLRGQAKIVVLSRHRESGYVREAFAAGARGYVLKQSPFDELRRAIEAVAAGRHHLDPALTAPTGHCVPVSDATVTAREQDILRRAALGHANKDIASSLEIAVKTVEAHKANGMRKLGLPNRQHLVRYAALQGWFEDA